MQRQEANTLICDVQHAVEKGMRKELQGEMFSIALKNLPEKEDRAAVDAKLSAMTTDILNVVLKINRELQGKSEEEIVKLTEERSWNISSGRLESNAVEKELKDVIYKKLSVNKGKDVADTLALVPNGVKTGVAQANWDLEAMNAAKVYLYIHEKDNQGYSAPHTIEIAAGIRKPDAEKAKKVKEPEAKKADSVRAHIHTSKSGRILQIPPKANQAAENA